MVSNLISRGMDVNILDNWGSTALSIALSESRFDLRIVQMLLDSGANPNTGGVEDQTPLHIAILERRSLATVMALVQHKADPNIQDWQGQTPLHLAVDCADVSVVKYLLHGGASSQIKDYTFGESPFIWIFLFLGRSASHLRRSVLLLRSHCEDTDSCNTA